jgi:PTH1 family peptidyl-tRNA hydrolase
MNKLLIVGLGNPGLIYESTRHNIGHAIVRAFCKDLDWKFKKDPHIKGELAIGRKDQKEIYVLFPTTYMNLSGLAIKTVMKMYDINIENLLVVVDDIYVPFGSFRLKEAGSAGGHNGLKSIEAELQSSLYSRLKVGVGAPYIGNLEDFVLGQFTRDEFIHIPRIINYALAIVDLWIKGDVGRAKEVASTTSLNS